MELKDTIELMESKNYTDRFKAEYYQTKIRKQKLENMLVKYNNKTLDFEPKCSFQLLLNQWQIMCLYLNLLEMRADIEEVRLDE